MRRVLLEDYVIKGIPVMAIYPQGAGKCPLVIFLHGFGGDRRSGLELGYRLADAGIFFLSFDAWLHGGRDRGAKTQRAFQDIYPADCGLDTYLLMHEVIRQTEDDLHCLVNGLREDARIDDQRIGVTGFSMGGFAAFLVAARCPWVKTAVPIGGKPAFQRAWDDLTLAVGTYPQWQDTMQRLSEASEERSRYLAEFDPFHALKSFAPKPLLIIHGDQDTDQPYLYSLELYRELKPLYARAPERLWLHMPPVGHCLTPDILQEVTGWFKKFL